MAIETKDGKAVPFHGDHHPVSVYEGGNPVFIPAESAKDGTELEFETTYNDVAEVTAWGGSEQATTTGKNLIGIRDFVATDAAAERGAADGRIYIKGITSFSTSYILTNTHGSNLLSSVPQGQFCVFSTHESGFSNERLVTSQGREIAKNTSFVLGVNETIAAVMCNTASIAANETKSCYIQIEKASAATSYEPYTGGKPSPSPEYPQEIRSVSALEVSSSGRNERGTTRAIDLQGNQLCALPDGTKDELHVHRDGRVELVKRCMSLELRVSDMNNSDNYPGWTNVNGLQEAFGHVNELSPCINTHGVYSAASGTQLSMGINTLGSSAILFGRAAGFGGMTQSQFKAAYGAETINFVVKMANHKTVSLGSVDPIPTYHPYTFISADGVDLTANVRIVE